MPRSKRGGLKIYICTQLYPNNRKAHCKMRFIGIETQEMNIIFDSLSNAISRQPYSGNSAFEFFHLLIFKCVYNILKN